MKFNRGKFHEWRFSLNKFALSLYPLLFVILSYGMPPHVFLMAFLQDDLEYFDILE